ncbi:hypothetical protein V5O48_014616 [Marasmius crinis-equi]|uniref:Uncharacterized protein n=1 Tax=Marasmius crinis-equi TaxID=585013 RepID=A0ABR3EWU0_9AGAR
MLTFKALVSLALTATTFAASAVRRQEVERAVCDFVFTPTTAPPENFDFVQELNFVVDREITVETDSGVFNPGELTAVANDDGSYTASGPIASNPLTADQLKDMVEAWPGKELQGLSDNGPLTWTVDSVECE